MQHDARDARHRLVVQGDEVFPQRVSDPRTQLACGCKDQDLSSDPQALSESLAGEPPDLGVNDFAMRHDALERLLRGLSSRVFLEGRIQFHSANRPPLRWARCPQAIAGWVQRWSQYGVKRHPLCHYPSIEAPKHELPPNQTGRPPGRCSLQGVR
jgi:hypothetical protein